MKSKKTNFLLPTPLLLLLAFYIPGILAFSGCQESVFQSLKKTDDLYVYEGLPHPGRENPSFEKERKREDIWQIKGHWFYEPKVKASGEIRDRLMNLLFDESGFGSNVIPTDCGPFHPDYAIMWESNGSESYLMMCYTCSEAKLIMKGNDKPHDLNVNKLEAWKNVLANFASKRPR